MHTARRTCYQKDTEASISAMCEISCYVNGSMNVPRMYTACPWHVLRIFTEEWALIHGQTEEVMQTVPRQDIWWWEVTGGE